MPYSARRSRVTVVTALAGIALLAGALSGCSMLSPESPEDPVVEQTAPEVPPQFFPDGSAEENLPYFAEVLRQFSLGVEPVEGQPIVEAVAASGFARDAMQVTFDRSKTNLVADSIMVSVLIGTECLIGQVQTSDRSVVTVVEAALTENANVCLIGNTRPIDW